MPRDKKNTKNVQPPNGEPAAPPVTDPPASDPAWLKTRMARATKAHERALCDRLGVDNMEEVEALLAQSQQPEPTPVVEPDPEPAPRPSRNRARNGTGADTRALQQQMAKLQANLDKASRKSGENYDRFKVERERRQELEQQIESDKTEYQLREAAFKSGITRPDYALLSLNKHFGKLSEEEQGAFNPETYLDQLAKDEPWLCNTTVAPATTGAGTNAAPPPPADPPPVSTFDATSATKEEVADRELQILRGATTISMPMSSGQAPEGGNGQAPG